MQSKPAAAHAVATKSNLRDDFIRIYERLLDLSNIKLVFPQAGAVPQLQLEAGIAGVEARLVDEKLPQDGKPSKAAIAARHAEGAQTAVAPASRTWREAPPASRRRADE